MPRKEDRRVKRTKTAIKHSLLNLLSQKSIDKVTIKELSDMANCDRKTIYNYYDSVYEILDDIELELVAKVEESIEQIDAYKHIEDKQPIEMFEELAKIIIANSDLMTYMVRLGKKSRLNDKIITLIKGKIVNLLKANLSGELDYEELATFVTAGYISVFEEWLLNNKSEDLVQITKRLGVVMISGLKNYFKIS